MCVGGGGGGGRHAYTKSVFPTLLKTALYYYFVTQNKYSRLGRTQFVKLPPQQNLWMKHASLSSVYSLLFWQNTTHVTVLSRNQRLFRQNENQV